MKTTFQKSITIIVLLSLFACKNDNLRNYDQEINDWRANRLERLKSKTGWLNLAGLFWLKEGNNTIGSDSSNTIIFPAKSDAFIGSINVTADSIVFMSSPESSVLIDGELKKQARLKTDADGRPGLMESGDLGWFIIKRGDKYAIRLRDYNSPKIASLEHIPAYKPSPEWRIEARFIPYDTIKKIETATMIGGVEINNCPGELVFRKGLEEFRLLPFSEDGEFFIIFGDKTNGIETYGNGRFLYASLPDSDNKVILDFNKAYNPPCAFTAFATCPMPPRENFLNLKVRAGEKEVHL